MRRFTTGDSKVDAAIGSLAAGTIMATADRFYKSYTSKKASGGKSSAVRRIVRKPLKKMKPMKALTNKKIANEVVKIGNRVSTLSKECKSNLSVLEYHHRNSGRILSGVNQSNFAGLESNSVVKFESVLGQLRFFNPATPGTLTTADGSTGTYAREYHFKSVYSSITCYNNYQVPVVLRLYCLTPKTDTSVEPATAFTNGLTDAGAPSSTSPAIFPSDSEEFLDIYNIAGSSTKILMPGQKMTKTWSCADVMYQPQIYDTVTSIYQKRYKSQLWAARVEGVLGHDTSANQQTLMAAGMDWVVHYKFTVHYDNGGAGIRFIYVSDSCPASFTNGGVMSEQPIADNIGYSIS